jgi:ATP-dependent protease ClpP protease subunit
MLQHPATILLYGNIDERMSLFFLKEMRRLHLHKNVLVRINSYGGDLLCALSIINVMKQHRGHVITLVDGFAASSASLIAASAQVRFMHKTSFQLAHKVVNDCPANGPIFNSVIKSIYKEDIPEDRWLTASECFEYRICDKII